MEHAIGTRITLEDGRKAEVVEIPLGLCNGCIFNFRPSYCCGLLKERGIIGVCFKIKRTDHKNIIYKEIKEE